ncbi:MAG: UDP-N-acetylglucosamine 1-carboxyvinyltransferase [Alphaproteobacteria bacterium]|nr:MAG: UDP-N-acetylglucosamine 1-carboxyvinyltransferase [Alphaproteobacteria bacterium]
MNSFTNNNTEKIYITGEQKLTGSVNISGAKNAALPLMALSLIINKDFNLYNVPDLADTRLMSNLLIDLGIDINWEKGNLTFNGKPRKDEASYDLVRQMRASILVLGPLLASKGSAKVPLPGGCAIGSRPIDLHVMVMEALGANVKFDSGFIISSLSNEGLKGGVIKFPKVSVGATESAIMTAVLAKGQTKIFNAAIEPEVTDLANCLNKAGADIKGIGTDNLIINGVKELNQVSHSVVSDRIEAASFAIASSITMGNVEINNINPENLTEFINVLKLTGSKVEIFENSMKVSCSQRPKTYNVETNPYPGFPTDLQAQYMALMAIANGKTLIKETIFENRFMHVPELMRMGAKIFVNQQEAEIYGVKKLKGAKVMASDLRASMCLIIAALAASGTSEIDGLNHLDRGYENLEDKLTNLGAIIKRSN